MKGRPEWILLLIVLGGCATRTGDVSQRMLLPEGVARYEMEPHQAFVFPVPLGNVAPAVPAQFEARELRPTTVCVAFVVDEHGDTSGVTPLEQPGCEMHAAIAPLLAEAVAAVQTWHFSPATFCEYPDAGARDRDWNGQGCAGQHVEARIVPVSLAYSFTFEVRNGKGRVVSRKR